MTETACDLPYPPSINHYWRHFRGRTVISQEGRMFRTNVCALLAGAGGARKPPAGGRVALAMDAFPPDRRRRDLDNLGKAPLDAIGHAGVYEDDSQIDFLMIRRHEVTPDGALIVSIAEMPLTTCPVCGAAMRVEDN